jgi:GH15 family glucan-1,4-alpha-glucosidase
MYAPIGDYGLIGNMRTAALVGMDGSIDWLCLPDFDSPSVFAALLDDAKGGRFRIAPADEVTARKQFYWPDTNVLITRFFTRDGIGQLTDYMPVGLPRGHAGEGSLVREVSVPRGSVRFRMECGPAFDYARAEHEAVETEGGVEFRSSSLRLRLQGRAPLELKDGTAWTEFRLREGESTVFALQHARHELPPAAGEPFPLFHTTVAYWHRWLAKCTYAGRWREMVQRSALTLKLLTSEETGAIVAAPTCSLPEAIGGVRNWDYRYVWIRDAAFTLYGLMRIGFTEEATRFMKWIEERCHEEKSSGPPLQVAYGIDGRQNLPEITLDHLEGYRGSRPVRIGNLAQEQFQLDIYGELMDAVYLYNKYGTPISYELWTHLRGIVDWLCDNWTREDAGIWEVRGPHRHFVYSKLMCWVALDRGLRLAEKRSLPCAYERWRRARDEIYETLMAKGWSAEASTFTQAFGTEALDAANLIMPLVLFLSPADPRLLGTLDATLRRPSEGGLVSSGLVLRYDLARTEDGLPGREGTFNICTFWLIEALTRAGREHPRYLAQARLLFEQMLGYANHLGLYSEQTGEHGEALGNYPQALTHLSLISAAYNLDRALGGPHGEETERTPILPP